MNQVLLACNGISKSFQEAENKLHVLKNVNLHVSNGEMLAILGSSGSGKSTLLHIMGTLDEADAGELIFDKQNLLDLSANQQAAFRNEHLGFVYQFHHLLPEFSALENVAMPLFIANKNKSEALDRASTLLTKVGLAERTNHKPYQLSGGERQRVAIARALINEPSIIMADEPTGNLDADTSQSIVDLIKDINATSGTAFVIVTHDQSIASQLDRTLKLHKGSFVEG
ncbi:lipoprotein-releasing ABC transporter ATP-binding protein LolD [Agaribacter marinus]|uniref:Lipoprotein-releasing system ATP-binding protein LolD n=1 Tax=Agaribacter marinus TaxID=1431249 RepID=A0AA37WGH5_9ALTE|nr:lipoprotein-releasing ABC transporter ATP-binding protein LolD [Agaribacter marinus]GLR70156.1 lipoprotein-releasing system ATP-binding protein LolD [Agaribacter marinus]